MENDETNRMFKAYKRMFKTQKKKHQIKMLFEMTQALLAEIQEIREQINEKTRQN